MEGQALANSGQPTDGEPPAEPPTPPTDDGEPTDGQITDG